MKKLLVLSVSVLLASCGCRDTNPSAIDLPADSIASLDTLTAQSDWMSEAEPSDYAIARTPGDRRFLYDLRTGQATYALAPDDDIFYLISQSDSAAYFLLYSPSGSFGYPQIIDRYGRRILSGPARYTGLPDGKLLAVTGLEQQEIDLGQTVPGTRTLAPAYPGKVRQAVVTGSRTMPVDTLFGYPDGTQNSIYLNLHYEEPAGTTAADYAMGTWVLTQVAEPLGVLDSMKYQPVIRTRDDYNLARENLRRAFFAINDSVATWSVSPVGVGVSMSLRWVQEGYYTYYRNTQSYFGGAHGYYTGNYLTYDMEAGASLEATSLFRPEAIPDVRQQLLDSLAADRSRAWGVDITAAQLDSLRGPIALCASCHPDGDGVEAVPALMPQGVVFSFQPYEIGSFADGIIRVVLPYAAVKDYLRPDAVRRLGL